jgi:hypothetical protein
MGRFTPFQPWEGYELGKMAPWADSRQEVQPLKSIRKVRFTSSTPSGIPYVSSYRSTLTRAHMVHMLVCASLFYCLSHCPGWTNRTENMNRNLEWKLWALFRNMNSCNTRLAVLCLTPKNHTHLSSKSKSKIM